MLLHGCGSSILNSHVLSDLLSDGLSNLVLTHQKLLFLLDALKFNVNLVDCALELRAIETVFVSHSEANDRAKEEG
jgi:hypothetical protein